MGINRGKFFDAKLTAEYFDGMNSSVMKYNNDASDAHMAFAAFKDEPSFQGRTATATKAFIHGAVGNMLTEISEVKDTMVKHQNHIMESFETMVDSSRSARIEFDTLEKINVDFKGYYRAFVNHAKDVEGLVNGLNSEFGSYAYFEQPDRRSAEAGFETICGGESEGAGHFRRCQDKLVEFDEAMKSYLKGDDIVDRTISMDNRLQDAASIRGEFTPEQFVMQEMEPEHVLYDGEEVSQLGAGVAVGAELGAMAAKGALEGMGMDTLGTGVAVGAALGAMAAKGALGELGGNATSAKVGAALGAMSAAKTGGAAAASAANSAGMAHPAGVANPTNQNVAMASVAASATGAVNSAKEQVDPEGIVDDTVEKFTQPPAQGQNTEGDIHVDSTYHDANRIGTVDEGFVTIIETNADGTVTTYYGGDQHWIQNDPYMGELANTYGCGVIAAINQSLYLTGRTTITKEEYMKLIDDYFAANDCEGLNKVVSSKLRKRAIKKDPHDAIPGNMLNYVHNVCEDNGVSCSSKFDAYNGYEKDYENMKTQIENGVPVIWSHYDKDGELVKYYKYNAASGEYYIDPSDPYGSGASSHYVMATAIYEDVDDKGNIRRMVEISSCGIKYYVDYDQYIEVVGDNIINRPFSSIATTKVD